MKRTLSLLLCLVLLIGILPAEALATDELAAEDSAELEELTPMQEEHVHSWTYSQQENKITATCAETESCGAQATLTLQQGDVEAGQVYIPFDAEELAQFNELTGHAVCGEDVVYYTDLVNSAKTTAEQGAAAEGALPTVEGTYVAQLALDELTVSAEFALLPEQLMTVADSTVMTVTFYHKGYPYPHASKTFSDFGTGWEEVIDAHENDRTVVTLYADWIAPGGHYLYDLVEYLEIDDSDLDITIDLNGYKIDHAGDSTFYDKFIFELSAGTLTIKDSVGTGMITGGNNCGPGGAFCMTGGTLNIQGGSITGNRSERVYTGGEGGAIWMDGGTLNITGGTFSGNSVSYYGGAIYMEGGTATISNCTFDGNTATRYGGAIYMNGGTATISNCTITGNTANEAGGAIYVDYGTLYIKSGTISNNTALNGGAIYGNDADDVHVYLQGGKISGNTATENGGGIYFEDGYLNISGGEISGNEAGKNGGGVYWCSSDEMLMTGGSITGNSTGLNNFGGGIFVLEDNVRLVGGSITGNKATRLGGGVYVDENAEWICVGGTLVVDDNFLVYDDVVLGENNLNQSVSGVGIKHGTKYNSAYALTNGARIGISCGYEIGTTSQISVTDGGFDQNSAQYFFADDSLFAVNVRYDANDKTDPYKLYLDKSERKIMATVSTMTEYYEFDTFSEAWDFAAELAEDEPVIMELQTDWIAPNGGFVGKATREGCLYLNDGDIELTIDLNGHNINRNLLGPVENGHVFYVDSASRFSIIDHVGGGSITGANNIGDGGAIYVSHSGVSLNGIKITGNKCTGYGGGLWVSDTRNGGSRVYVRDCTFTGNEAVTGGAIAGKSNVEMSVSDSTICGNKATKNGGGISWNGKGLLHLEQNVTICHNEACGSNGENGLGGGVYVFGGGHVDLLTASGTPMAIYSDSVVITENKAREGGGIYWTSTSNLYTTGVTITNNIATERGGGVYMSKNVAENATLENQSYNGYILFGGKCVVTGNTANNADSDVYLESLAYGIHHSVGRSLFVYEFNTPLQEGSWIGIDGPEELLSGKKISGSGAGFYIDSHLYFYANDDDYYICNKENSGYQLWYMRRDSADYNTTDVVVSDYYKEILTDVSVDNEQNVITLTAKNDKKKSMEQFTLGYLIEYNTNQITIADINVEYNLLEPQRYVVYGKNNIYELFTVVVEPEGGAWAEVQDDPIEPYNIRVTMDGITRCFADAMKGWNDMSQYVSSGKSVRVELLEDWIAGGTFTGTGTDSGRLAVNGYELTLDLKGNTLSRGLTAAKDDGQIFVIAGSGSLTIQDSSSAKTGKITGGKNTDKGGAVYVDKGKLTLESGTITGNQAKYGGAIYNDYGTVTITGGKISGNTATVDGGGIYVDDTTDCILNVNGGEITGNTAAEDGGGIFVYNGYLNIRGGEISGNRAKNGGGVYWESRNYFCLTGGVITGNTATVKGGGVYSTDWGDTFLGGTIRITGNTGYNLFLEDDEVLNHTVGQKTGVPNAPLRSDALIGIHADSTMTVSADDSGFGKNSAIYFETDSSEYLLQYNTEESALDLVKKDGIDTIQVKFSASGSTSVMDPVTHPRGTAFTLPESKYSYPGAANFLVWAYNGAEYKPGDKVILTENAEFVVVWKYLAPTGITAVNATCDQNNGSLNGVLNDMEYSTDQVIWTKVLNDKAENLSGGIYYVRIAAMGQIRASDSVMLFIQQEGHVEIPHEAKDPTCSEVGWDAYITCERCDYTTYQEKATLPHSFDENGFCTECDAYQPAVLDETVYMIGNAGQLYWFAQQVNSGNSAINGKLTADIAVPAGTPAWTPIASNYSVEFTGCFDGAGKTVRGLVSDAAVQNNSAFFGRVGASGVVKNVHIADASFSGNNYVAGLVGLNKGTVTNCSSFASVNGNTTLGGIVAYNDGGIVTNSYFFGTIEGEANAGGVVGYNANNGRVANCYYLDEFAAGGINGYDEISQAEGKTKAQFESGEVTYLLRQGCTVGESFYSGDIWGQKLGDDQVPVLNGMPVYLTVGCVYTYTNVEGEERHIFADDGDCTTDVVCTNCQKVVLTARDQHVLGVDDGDCTTAVTCAFCQVIMVEAKPHTPAYKDGNCTIEQYCTVCGSTLPAAFDEHTYSNGFCVRCDSYQPASGTGTASDPYQIGNAGQLYWFAAVVNSGYHGTERNVTACAVLTGDIVVNANVLMASMDLNGTGTNFRAWVPIGTNMNPYSGIFDGANHSISGLYVNDPDASYVGLFGGLQADAVVKNLGIVDSWIMGGSYVAAVAGYTSGQITNCYSAATIGAAGSYVGGIAGYHTGNAISNCYNTGRLEGFSHIGGIAGYSLSSVIVNCYYTGSATGRYAVGGIAGLSNTSLLANCYSVGTVTTSGEISGNVVGVNESGAVENSYYGVPAGASASGNDSLGEAADNFADGRIAWLLSQGCTVDGVKYAGEVWGQELGVDEVPVLNGMTVYLTEGCVRAYTNTQGEERHVYTDDGDCTTACICSECNAVVREAEAEHEFGSDHICTEEYCTVEEPVYAAFYSLSLKGDIGVNYYMHIDDSIADGTMKFTTPRGGTVEIPIDQAETKTVANKTYYVFTVTVAAKEMTDTIVGQYFYGDGKASDEYSYSVKQYAEIILENKDNNAAYAKAQPMVEAMLKYGAYAQLHFGYNTDRLAAEISADDLKAVTTENLANFKAPAAQGTTNAPVYAYSLVLKTETTLRVYFRPNDQVETLKVSLNGQPMTVKSGKDLLYVEITNISAKDLDTDWTLTVDDGMESATVVYNALAYGYTILSAPEGTYTTYLQDTVKALYLYNQAANAYFGTN